MSNDYYNYELFDFLESRKQYLARKLQAANRQAEKLQDLPVHMLRIQKHGKGYQYYLREGKQDSRGKYVKKAQLGPVRNTLQLEYLQKLIPSIQEELALLDKYLNHFSPDTIPDIFEKLNKGRKIMISPIEISDADYAAKWAQVKYEGKEFPEGMPEYYTAASERVRSKSEIIIANTLAKYHVPYRYEYPINLKGLGTIHPDFTVLNVKKRKELYLEHFGLLDDKDYRDNAMRKLAFYEKNNIFPGDRLIITCETSTQPLDVKNLELKIKKYLL